VNVAADFSALEAKGGNYMAVGHAPNLGADQIHFLWQLRHYTGEFYENRAAARKIARRNAAKSVSCKTIPCKMKQGINSRRTGNLSSRAGNLQRLAGNCPPCAGAVEQPQRRLLGVSGLAIEDFKLKASTNAQLTSQPKPR
jgi:hypothetical protein